MTEKNTALILKRFILLHQYYYRQIQFIKRKLAGIPLQNQQRKQQIKRNTIYDN